MSLTVGELVAYIRADSSQFDSSVDKSGQKFGELGSTITAGTQEIGRALLTVGAGVTAVGTVIAKVGIDFNTLEQTSRAALSTLLGGTKAANDQMDKLDVFARTSPFAKQVFITAQQQLIGFGMAAKDVIPTLDAIQNAVAATGGSNQDIADLTRIIAQVGASGKITAVDLMQFGQRGVDAATLIGAQMGETGVQIRDDITKGTLGADVAITALVAGMDQKFGGAAANVKTTFAGATDNVKAAWRDLSGQIMAPLVNPLGGGMAVDALNHLADAMRQFEKLPGPIKDSVVAAGALIGVVALLGGAFVEFGPKVQIASARIVAWGISTKAQIASVSIIAGVLAVATLAFLAWGTAQANAAARVDTFKDSLDKATGAITTNTRAVAFNGLQQDGMIDKAKRAGVNLDDLVTASIDPTSDAYKRLETQLNTASDALSKVANAKPGSGAGPGPNALSNWSDMVDVLKSVGIQQGSVADSQSKWRDEQAAGIATTGALGSATDATTAAIKAQEDATKALDDAYAKWITDTANIDASFVSLGGGYDTIVQKNKDVAQSTADSTKSTKDSWQKYYDGFTVSVDGYLAELQRQVDAQGAWETNMLLLSGKVSQGTLDELKKLGPEGAPLVAQLTTASDAELTKLDAVFAQKAQTATENFAVALNQAAPLIAWAAATLGQGAADEIAAKLGAGTATVASIMAQYGIMIDSIHPNMVVTVAENDAAARATFAQLMTDMGGARPAIHVTADTSSARATFAQLMADMGGARVPFKFGNAAGRVVDFIPNATGNLLDFMSKPRPGSVKEYAAGGLRRTHTRTPQMPRLTTTAPRTSFATQETS